MSGRGGNQAIPPGTLQSLRSLFLDAYTSGDGTVRIMVFPAETQIPPLRHRPLGTVRYGDIDRNVNGCGLGFPSGEGSDRPGVELPGEGRFVFEITVSYSRDRFPPAETTDDFNRYKVGHGALLPEDGKARIEAFRKLAKKAAVMLQLSGTGSAFDNLELLWITTIHKLVPGRTHDAFLASVQVLSLLENGGTCHQVAPAVGKIERSTKAKTERMAAELLKDEPDLLDNIRQLARRLGRSWAFTNELDAVQNARTKRNDALRRRREIPLTDEMLGKIDGTLKDLIQQQTDDDDGSPLTGSPSPRRRKTTKT